MSNSNSNVNKYNNGKIYKIITNCDANLVYYGSTCSALSQRLAEHRRNYSHYMNDKYHYVTSFELIKQVHYDIILVETVVSSTKEELHARERYYIENNECVNKYIPGRTKKEHYEANKDDIAMYKKDYHEANKDAIHKHKNQQNKCECGCIYTFSHRSRHMKSIKHTTYIKNNISTKDINVHQ